MQLLGLLESHSQYSVFPARLLSGHALRQQYTLECCCDTGTTSRPSWSRASSTAGSTENLHHAGGMSSSRLPLPGSRRSSGIPSPASSYHRQPSDSPDATLSPTHTSFRSNSAIDLQAARRAQARAQYAQAQRMKVGSGASLRE